MIKKRINLRRINTTCFRAAVFQAQAEEPHASQFEVLRADSVCRQTLEARSKKNLCGGNSMMKMMHVVDEILIDSIHYIF